MTRCSALRLVEFEGMQCRTLRGIDDVIPGTLLWSLPLHNARYPDGKNTLTITALLIQSLDA